MLVVVSDTHGTDDHRLSRQLLNAVREADRVIHAGDFTTEAVLDSFHEIASELHAVHGNADGSVVCERLPTSRTLMANGVRIAVTHRQNGGSTGLTMFGRQQGADLVISGHTHRPSVSTDGDVTLLNPGSYADPRGNRPGYAELRPTDDGLSGVLSRPDGTKIERFDVRATTPV